MRKWKLSVFFYCLTIVAVLFFDQLSEVFGRAVA